MFNQQINEHVKDSSYLTNLLHLKKIHLATVVLSFSQETISLICFQIPKKHYN